MKLYLPRQPKTYLLPAALLLAAAGATASTAADINRARRPETATIDHPDRIQPPTPKPPVHEPPLPPPPITPTTTDLAAYRTGRALDSLRTRAPFPNTANGEVDRWTLRLATRNRNTTASQLARMAYYEPLIRQALAQHKMPRDLIALAMIESGFTDRAVSHAGATGMWQFMRATAAAYGLEISPYVDERRDPIRATFAAIAHLDDLHNDLGSWHLAAAAYNTGSGRISRTLARRHIRPDRDDERPYWLVRDLLPRETQDYVPRLLAAARIINDPDGYGFPPQTDANALRFREVWIDGATSFATIASRYRLDANAIAALNPHLTRHTTPPGRRWPVRIPA